MTLNKRSAIFSRLSCFVIYLFVFVTSRPCFGVSYFEALPSEAEGKMIARVEVSGLQRTQYKVVKRELLFDLGDIFRAEAFELSLARLRNLRIFRAVVPLLQLDDEKRVHIRIEVDEKWTTIPVVRGGGGGGTSFFIIGAYDINSFGLYQELGSQYENYSGASSVVAWYRNPRWRDERQRLSLDVGTLSRIAQVYNNGTAENQYLLRKKRLSFSLERELLDGFVLGVGVDGGEESFSTQYEHVPSEPRPSSGNGTFARFSLRLGELNSFDYLVDGQSLELSLDVARRAWSDYNFYRLVSTVSFFRLLPLRGNFASRVSVGTSDATQLQHRFALGGLENVRGFFDGEFRGQSFAFGNLELRIPSFENPWFVSHHVLFYDVLKNYRNRRQSDAVAQSAGTGVRFLVPKIYRLVVRADYGWVLTPRKGQGVSFGMQQYF